MDLRTKLNVVGGAVGAAAGALGAWTVADALSRWRVERVEYTRVGGLDGVELRRYPELVGVETTAPSERTAFRRLSRYLDGANDRGERVAMTAPVETERSAEGVTMTVFLPSSYAPETAPEPSNEAVSLRVNDPRTVAVLSFSWWTPGFRVRRRAGELRDALAEADVETVGDPVLWRYDAPATPPFARTNEVVVEVDSGSVRRYLAGERST